MKYPLAGNIVCWTRDDNRDAAESLAMLLSLEGHTVTVVHDGQQALAAFQTMQPEFALLDIGMPIVSGYDVARLVVRAPWAARSLSLRSPAGARVSRTAGDTLRCR